MTTLCSQKAGQTSFSDVSTPVMKNTMNSLLRAELNKTFILKCEANPRYSLRAFAKYLKVDPTLLSRLMKGQRAFSKKMTARFLNELNIPLEKTFVPVPGKKLTDGIFQPLSKWYFFAILELFQLPDFKSDTKWISKRLGLSLTETNAALQVLAEGGHIEIDKKPWRVCLQHSFWTNFKSTSRERMNYQKQLLEKGKEAIDSVDFSMRESASLTLAASSQLIPEIKDRIQKFKNEMRELIESQGNYDEVYQIVISYFPLTEKEQL